MPERKDQIVAYATVPPPTERQELLPKPEKLRENPGMRIERTASFGRSSTISQRTASFGKVPRASSTSSQRSRSDVHGILSLEEGPGYELGPIYERLTQDATAPGSEEGSKPVDSTYIFGLSKRLAFPVGFAAAAALGLLYTLTLQRAWLQDALGGTQTLSVLFGINYGVACFFALKTGLADPGRVSTERTAHWEAGEQLLPRRAHKNFLYDRPVLRFDHYCRWLVNCIGLQNHREFMVMISSLVVLMIAGAITDVALLLRKCWPPPPAMGLAEAALVLHLAGSLALAVCVCPIWRLHFGLILRNELAYEWKWEEFRVIRHNVTGVPIMVAGLDQDEYDLHCANGTVEYDPTLNQFDQGFEKNCLAFWCTSRWDPEQLGEF